ncbi:MAG: hypothetical protein IT305_19755 [Chloroflexi bacterium]|nr:hypothetical protein [Chloroflexota bacterium]
MEQARSGPDPTAAEAPGGGGDAASAAEQAAEQGRGFAVIAASIAHLDDLDLAGVEPASVFQW